MSPFTRRLCARRFVFDRCLGGVAAAIAVVGLGGVPEAGASQLIDRNVQGVKLEVNAKGEAMLTYEKGRSGCDPGRDVARHSTWVVQRSARRRCPGPGESARRSKVHGLTPQGGGRASGGPGSVSLASPSAHHVLGSDAIRPSPPNRGRP